MSRFISYLNSCNCRIYPLEGQKKGSEKKETKLVVYYDIQDISSPTPVCTNYDSSMKSMEVDGKLLDSVVTTYQFNSVGEHIIKYEFNNPTSVGNGAPLFRNISTIKRIIVADTFTTIAEVAFLDCNSLTSVTIGNNITSIGGGVLSGCLNLVSVKVENGNTVYDSRNNCNAIIKTTTNELITGCKNTVIPNSVTSIGNSAFDSCESLTSITIPNSVTTIGKYAFNNCSSLVSITSFATTAPTIQSDTFRNIKTNGILTVPNGSSGYDVWMGTGDYYLGKYGWTMVEQ